MAAGDSLASSDEEPTDIGEPGLTDDERILFAFTNPNEDFVDSSLGVTPRPRIDFSSVREPSGILFFTLGGAFLTLTRRRQDLLIWVPGLRNAQKLTNFYSATAPLRVIAKPASWTPRPAMVHFFLEHPNNRVYRPTA